MNKITTSPLVLAASLALVGCIDSSTAPRNSESSSSVSTLSSSLAVASSSSACSNTYGTNTYGFSALPGGFREPAYSTGAVLATTWIMAQCSFMPATTATGGRQQPMEIPSRLLVAWITTTRTCSTTTISKQSGSQSAA